jgi:hypothetical protein
MFHTTIIIKFLGSTPRVAAKGDTLFKTLTMIDGIDVLNMCVQFLFTPFDPWNHDGLKRVTTVSAVPMLGISFNP